MPINRKKNPRKIKYLASCKPEKEGLMPPLCILVRKKPHPDHLREKNFDPG
jgi:hypothetical protein